MLNLGTRWRLVVNFAPRLLYSGKEPWYLLDRRLDGLQSRSGSFGEQKGLLSVPEFEPRNSCIRVNCIMYVRKLNRLFGNFKDH